MEPCSSLFFKKETTCQIISYEKRCKKGSGSVINSSKPRPDDFSDLDFEVRFVFLVEAFSYLVSRV
jgi:hypothetical protein